VIKKSAAADYEWGTVVVGADLDAVRFAHDNKYFLIKNRLPHHHSYEKTEQEWAEKIYHLYEMALVPFTNKLINIRIFPEENILKVFTDRNIYTVRYDKLHLYDDENVEGLSLNRELLHYRVVDWFDCQGLYDLDFDEIITDDKFVNIIKLFKTRRIDGNQKYLDLLCESFLTESELKSFDYSDTMARFKTTELLEKRGIKKVKMFLWKRDIYPVYE
tara:strand:- start:5895 stop:6545 length:651 start_codon:yes stop_codon:yes gene_type:complete